MAEEWIKMRTDLHEDPKVISIASDLGLSEDEVVGKLLRFWSWADSQLESGDAPSVTTSWVDRHVGAVGFAQALMKAGWLLAAEKGIIIPEFERHLGKRARRRALAARRTDAYRKAEAMAPGAPAPPDGDARSVPGASRSESHDLVDEVARHLNLGYAKAGRVVHEVGVGPEDWKAWLSYEEVQGTALTVQNIQRYRNPEEIPKPVAGQRRGEWPGSRRRSSFAKPDKFSQERAEEKEEQRHGR